MPLELDGQGQVRRALEAFADPGRDVGQGLGRGGLDQAQRAGALARLDVEELPESLGLLGEREATGRPAARASRR
ncbi:MAG: hypothetical protein R3F30_06735 [Planctomycetota bacterium]